MRGDYDAPRPAAQLLEWREAMGQPLDSEPSAAVMTGCALVGALVCAAILGATMGPTAGLIGALIGGFVGALLAEI
jgi:hypothetical protein